MSRTLRLLRDNVLGLLAITIALSASAYAVTQAPKDSVVSSSIKNGQVKGVDVKDDALTGKQVDESTLTLPAGAGGTVTSVTAGAGLEGGTITRSGTVRLAGCPATQVLKSNGAGYDCAPDADTTYTAGAGLQLSGGELSLADGGVTGAQIADDSITAADLGFVQTASIPAGNLPHGLCAGVNSFVTDGPGAVGDFALTTSEPAMPSGVITSGRVGPLVGGTSIRQYNFFVCNFSGTTAAIPSGTMRMLVITQ